jgi:hypothetical protein
MRAGLRSSRCDSGKFAELWRSRDRLAVYFVIWQVTRIYIGAIFCAGQ